MTTPTSEPIVIDGPADVDEPAVRGEQEEITADDLPEGQCWVPVDRLNEFPMLNYVPCEQLEVSLPEASIVVAVGQPPIATNLPETGSGTPIQLGVAATALVLGVALVRLVRRSPL